MPTIRMLPPPDVRYQTRAANGRSYTGTPGSTQDVPDVDASILSANGWVSIAPSGATAQRPSGSLGIYAAAAGTTFFDTTVNALIIFDGATWRSPVDGSPV